MLLKFSKFFLYTSLFSVVIVMATTFFPFIGGKYYFFRVTVEAAIVFFILWWAFEAEPKEAKILFENAFREPLVVAVTLFVFFYVLASLLAHDPRAGFWSNYERGEGGFQMLHYYIFFLLLVLLFRKGEDWIRLFKMSLVAATLMILYGVLAQDVVTIRGLNAPYERVSSEEKNVIFQPLVFVGPYSRDALPETRWERLTMARFQGSLGNPAYVAPYLMFAIFFALSLIASRGIAHKKKSFWIRLGFYVVLSLVFLVFFVLSQTRGAFLGFAAAIVAVLLYYALWGGRWRKVGLIGLAGLVLLGGLLYQFRENPFVKNSPASRLLELSFGERTVQTRLWTWGSALKGFRERPVLGWGPENFSTVFDKYFDPRHFIPETNAETWFDRAHSVFFGYLVDTGVLGFLSYLAIFAVFYRQFFKKFLSQREGREVPLSQWESALLFALPVGYLAQGIVLFDVLPIYMNLFAFLGYGAYLFHHAVHSR